MTATKLATLFAHDDGRHAVWPGVESPPWTHGDPGWHRVGPVDVDAIATPQCLAQIEEPAGAAPAAVAPQGERQWICPTRTVADLVNNLLTMDQALPIYGAQYIEKDGRRCAITVPPTVSRERVQDGRWIGQGEELNAAVVWTRAEQPVAAPGLTDGQLDDESYRVNDEPGFADAFRAGARFAERVHGVTASAARAVTGKADWWRGRADEIEVRVARSGSQEAMRCYTDMRTLLQAAAPALEAPPAVTGRTVPRNDDERAAAQFFADNPGAALLAWPLYFARDKSPALEAPAAPVGSARQFIEWMYSQPEDREPTTAEGALLEFEAHLAAAAPQAPAAPVHSKTYSDGTVATGSGELPAQSPQQQVLCTLLDTVEAMLGGANGPTIQIRAALLAAPAAPAVDAQPLIARSIAEWHEDDGDVSWWAWCGRGWAGEPAWIGRPTDDGWPGYHTHWTAHPAMPPAIAAQVKEGGESA